MTDEFRNSSTRTVDELEEMAFTTGGAVEYPPTAEGWAYYTSPRTGVAHRAWFVAEVPC